MPTFNHYVINGGIPDGWTLQNLDWLAKAHRRLAADHKGSRIARTDWHQRWAALIEDVLESRHGENHRV